MFNNNNKIKALPIYFSKKDNENLIVSIELGTWLIVEDNIVKLLKDLEKERLYSQIKNLINDIDEENLKKELIRLYKLGFLSIDGKNNIPSKGITDSILDDNKEPNLFILHVSNNCNLNCKYCYAHTGYTTKKNMSFDVMKKSIDKFFEVDTNNLKIEFHGGEPLMQYKNISKACSYAIDLAEEQQKTISFSMQSNLTFLTDECVDMLKKYNIDIRISMDGKKEDNDYYRVDKSGNGSYDKIISNLKKLNEVEIYPEVVAVVSKRNIDNLIEIYKLFASLNLINIRLIPFWSQGMGSEMSSDVVEPEVLANKYIELMEWIIQYNKKQTDSSKKFKMFSVQKEIEVLTTFSRSYMCLRCPCGAGINMVNVNVEGNIYPCEEMNEVDNFYVGNIYKGSIKEQYEKSNVVKALKRRNPDNIEECVNCAWKRHCQSGCANKNYQKYGKIESKSDKCDFYKKYFEDLIWFLNRYKDDYKELL